MQIFEPEAGLSISLYVELCGKCTIDLFALSTPLFWLLSTSRLAPFCSFSEELREVSCIQQLGGSPKRIPSYPTQHNNPPKSASGSFCDHLISDSFFLRKIQNSSTMPPQKANSTRKLVYYAASKGQLHQILFDCWEYQHLSQFSFWRWED